jgi:hypothetical protein
VARKRELEEKWGTSNGQREGDGKQSTKVRERVSAWEAWECCRYCENKTYVLGSRVGSMKDEKTGAGVGFIVLELGPLHQNPW